jgi:hypothetical protein
MSRRAVWQLDADSRGWPRRSSSPKPNAPGVAASISGEPAAGVKSVACEPRLGVEHRAGRQRPGRVLHDLRGREDVAVVEAQIRDARSGASERLRANPDTTLSRTVIVT